MYPSTLTQLARGNPFSAPLFTLQKAVEPETPVQKRRLAAAATAGKIPSEHKTTHFHALPAVKIKTGTLNHRGFFIIVLTLEMDDQDWKGTVNES